MRAKTKGKHRMGRRFAVVIGVAAAGVMALGAQTVTAQTAAEPPAVVKYDTELTISQKCSLRCLPKHGRFFGTVWSQRVPGADRSNLVSKCMNRRRVILFRKRPGPDRKLGADRSSGGDPTIPETRSGDWQVSAPKGTLHHGDIVYAKATPKVGDGFVCRADRSPIYTVRLVS